jgi:pimeloyl-ACP methyl ester carboxylesterase
MPFALVDGIHTYYEVSGSGPPLLLFSPGGFNATLENWSSFGIYRRLGLLERLQERYTCIAFDRRESGRSGGRVERLTWSGWAGQGAGLLDELGIERAHLLGGCVGCSAVLAFAVARPERTASMVLYSPAGGPRYRMAQHARFEAHLAYVEERGLEAVVELARSGEDTFSQDPRVGPWSTPIRADEEFARAYAAWDPASYLALVRATAAELFDRDTVSGAEPQELMRLEIPALVVPGRDRSHATSAARYLEECLEGAAYWDAPPEEQTAETAPARLLQFLAESDSPRSRAAI